MKRNAKTIIAGMIALAISHTAMADDIKVAVVGAMSGPIAQWGDMEFNGARQARSHRRFSALRGTLQSRKTFPFFCSVKIAGAMLEAFDRARHVLARHTCLHVS